MINDQIYHQVGALLHKCSGQGKSHLSHLWDCSFFFFCEISPEVPPLRLLSQKCSAEEKMWQCKADILRLEFLWHHGGLYVDAAARRSESPPLKK